MKRRKYNSGPASRVIQYLTLILFSALALFPILLVISNSFKTRKAIFASPLAFPTPETFSLKGYNTVLLRSNYFSYFGNSIIVTLISLALIILFGAMAAWALSEYKFKGNKYLGLYLALGIMIPIRLGTVAILRLCVSLGLVNTLLALILVYTAQGLPLTIFIMQQFMIQIPSGLKDAGRVDGATEYRIFFLILPMVRPALATVAVFTMMPIWNDLWFPLILAPSEGTKTLILGAQMFLGQFVTDWNSVLSALTMAIVPVIILYIIFSKQLISGLTAGSIKS
ncbi:MULTISPECIES: carbohydrate ABC transporter permease [unclassified Oceanispirochaeta]|uniref:carbohydrate ABC transporter permease n=1 Tax=unclassified Oceanispirochaeta TaxID=2635722 RepID=UPI000E095A6A|nr:MULTISPECIES: carbohydrate ABC transporter permease [unclassified Oceanispirochaeta]MBF9017225.1 carbohydrate ABC transporter permease [Oceanispirochaeta sp. M2]NPD73674.1 carbohydrate ABC transporter permease [Oceanispirochaeta sp. M1]RDG30604.1 carbohydrate ABC transporter permease [Oceanispirochaeta sp. M1]